MNVLITASFSRYYFNFSQNFWETCNPAPLMDLQSLVLCQKESTAHQNKP